MGPFTPSLIPKSTPETPRTSSNDTSPHGSGAFQSPIVPSSNSSQNQSSSYDNSPSQDRSGQQQFLNVTDSPSRHSYQSSPPDVKSSMGKNSGAAPPPPKPLYMQNRAAALPPPVNTDLKQLQYTHTNSGLGISPLYGSTVGPGYQDLSSPMLSGTADRSGPLASESSAMGSQKTSNHAYYDLGSVVVSDDAARDIPQSQRSADDSRGWSSMPSAVAQSSWNDVADLERNDAEDYGPGTGRGGGSLSVGTISNVASFHRRVRRPHNQQYERQDLEWDGSGGLSPNEPYGTRGFRPSSYQGRSDNSWTMA